MPGPVPETKVPATTVKPNSNPNQKQQSNPNQKRVNVMSSGFATGVVTKGQPMSLAEQKAKKNGGIF